MSVLDYNTFGLMFYFLILTLNTYKLFDSGIYVGLKIYIIYVAKGVTNVIFATLNLNSMCKPEIDLNASETNCLAF